MGQMSKFLAIRQDFSLSPGFPIKVLGKGEQSTPDGCNNFVKFLVRRENAWHMILEDNPAGHGFVLKDLVLIELFQISHNGMHASGKMFVKSYQRYLFSRNMWNFPICYIFIQQKGKVETFRLAGRPLLPIFLAQWDILMSPWSAYCSDFLSKQNIYNM